MKYEDIPKLTQGGNYRVNVDWNYLLDVITRYQSDHLAQLDMNPSFQRAHVWTEEQQTKYVEFKLRGGSGANEIQFNCRGWMNGFEGPFVIVDGKQRIQAVTMFIQGKIKAFGCYLHEYENSKVMLHKCDFVFCINNLDSYLDVMKWYLELNSGGTPHTAEELDKVKNLIAAVGDK
jgi:hypothetical protein